MNPLSYLRSWFTDGHHLIHLPQFPDTGVTMLQDLPIEVRVDIWKLLSVNEHKALRLQCKQFAWEVDQLVGVHAILTGPKQDRRFPMFKNGWLRPLIIGENPDIKRAKHNVEWVTNSFVRGLSLSNLNQLNFDPSLLIKNTFAFHKLHLEMDYLRPKAEILELLIRCNNLRTISMTCRNLYACEQYRREVNTFHQEILEVLTTNTNSKLKRVSICTDLGQSFYTRFDEKTFLGAAVEVAPTEPTTKYPSIIQILKIEAPILQHDPDDYTKLTTWKAFMEQQQVLTELDVDLGFVHWTFFSNVIQKNLATLKKLCLYLSNWHVARTSENWHDDVPLDQLLDWSQLITNPANLTSLTVIMSTDSLRVYDFAPHGTLNFMTLNLNALEKLELRSVFLTGNDFRKIFSLPNLSDVDLKHWSTLGQPADELKTIAITTFTPIFLALITTTHLKRVHLSDGCLILCPISEILQIGCIPNYEISRIFGGLPVTLFTATGEPIQDPPIDEMLLTRKAEHWLVPPFNFG